MLLHMMHTKTNTSAKEMVELDMPATLERQTSFNLEDDLAISSSTQDSIADKTITEAEEKTTPDETTHHSDLTNSEPDQPPVIYVSEDAMDCNYDESSNLSRPQPQPQHFEIQDAPSPELFESDADDEAESTNTTSTFQKSLEEARPSLPSPKKLSTAELILKADKFLLRRVNKFLSGVPPPPNHTISQKDCDDFLVYIKQNRQYFWADPFKLDEKNAPVTESDVSSSQQEFNQEKNEETTTSSTSNKIFPHTSQKAGLRNLSTAFDACEQSSYLKVDKNDSLAVDAVFSDTTSSFTLSDTLYNSSILSSSTFALNEDSKLGDADEKESPPTLFTSIKCDEVANLSWPTVLQHKCPEIYYNRNKAMEEFENLRLKLCERYIGAETQSTCNVWFAKQIPGSARKRSLLARRNMGQSPGKRLSYLARRRRTFSSANVQGLGLAEKKQVMLNIKKVIRRGKSPRGKSPRGKTPRKTPRSSAKKRHMRRLLLEGPSPRKSKIETSKRALFQSPPTDRPGPSRLSLPTATVTTSTINNPQKIKRALFPTPKKNEVDEISQSQPMNFVDSRKLSQPHSTTSFMESRKRKSDEELEHSKHKWAKSLSFDCARNFENSSSNMWNTTRHSTGSSLSKDGTPNYGKSELSDTHRKKLLWAVAEALRSKGIGMKDPMFKQYAANLARTVRKFMPDLENKNVPRKPGSTSDRMLKLAKRHVLLIVEAKTAL